MTDEQHREYVAKWVAEAGQPTPELIRQLRALLPPVPRNEGGKAA